MIVDDLELFEHYSLKNILLRYVTHLFPMCSLLSNTLTTV